MRSTDQEKIPFLSEVVISIDDKLEKINLLNLPQDVIDQISHYLRYKNELINLSMTSHKMNKYIQHTPAGKLANLVKYDSTVRNTIIVFSVIGGLAAFAGGIKYVADIDIPIWGKILFDLFTLPAPVFFAFATCLCVGMAIAHGLLMLGCLGNDRRHMGLFMQAQRINEVKEELNHPITSENKVYLKYLR